MQQKKYYQYLGTNGTILSTVFLEGIYSVKKIELIADLNKQLTKNGVDFVKRIIVPENELDLWHEVDMPHTTEGLE